MGSALADRVVEDQLSERDAHASVLGASAGKSDRPPSPAARGSRARVASAALCCVGRFGVSKTTVDDIAREAGLARATVYRAFPGGRDEILSSLVQSEVASYFDRLSALLDAAAGNLEDLLTVALSAGSELLARHETLSSVMAYEPELILPLVSFSGFDHVLAVARRHLAPYLRTTLGETEADRLAEWVTRLLISYLLCPAGAVDRRGAGEPWTLGQAPLVLRPEPIGEERARHLVRLFVLPGIRVLSTAERRELIEPTTD